MVLRVRPKEKKKKPSKARYLGHVVYLAGDVSVKKIWLTGQIRILLKEDKHYPGVDSATSPQPYLAAELLGQTSALIPFNTIMC